MKKIIKLIVIIFLLPFSSFGAGEIEAIWTEPAAWQPTDDLTIYFDVTGTDLAGNAGPLFIWTWSPQENSDVIGSWGNSNDQAKLTQVNGNIWKFEMGKPTEFYRVTAEQVRSKTIFGLLKTKTGDKQSDNFDGANGIAPFDFSIYENLKVGVFPEKFDANTQISIMVNVNLAEDDNLPKIDPAGPVYMSAGLVLKGFDDLQRYVPYDGTPKDGKSNTKLTRIGETSIWRMDMKPADYFGLAMTPFDSTKLFKQISAVFTNSDSTAKASNNGSPFIIGPVPVPSTFPAIITPDDLMTIYFDAKEDFAGNTPLLLTNDIYVEFTINENIKVKKKMDRGFNNNYKYHAIPNTTFMTELDGDALLSLTYVITNEDGSDVVMRINEDNEAVPFEVVLN